MTAGRPDTLADTLEGVAWVLTVLLVIAAVGFASVLVGAL